MMATLDINLNTRWGKFDGYEISCDSESNWFSGRFDIVRFREDGKIRQYWGRLKRKMQNLVTDDQLDRLLEAVREDDYYSYSEPDNCDVI